MAVPVIVGSLQFRTKTGAKQFFRDLRDSYSDGERISDEHAICLRDLVAIHPESELKAGAGISHFSVATDAEFRKTRHFFIHRLDGTGTDVSFNSAIDGRNPKRDRLEALRRGIQDQILEFRRIAFTGTEPIECPLRGLLITQDAYHIDHTPPSTFLSLAENWLQSEEISISQIEITPPADNQIVTEMTSTDQLSSWRAFHAAHAKLRLLSPLGNLSDAKIAN